MRLLPTFKTGTIYVILNTANGFKYVGQTFGDVETRFRNHCKQARFGSKIPLHKAIRDYGVSAFEIQVVETEIHVKKIDERERFYIEHFQSLIEQRGYNCQTGGQKCHSASSHTREKISKAQKGRVFSDAHRKALSEANKRRHERETKEEKRNQAELMNKARLAKGCSKETREKQSKRMKGNTFRRDFLTSFPIFSPGRANELVTPCPVKQPLNNR